jgi:hypothetical protein
MMVLTFLVMAGCRAVLMETEVGQQALVDQWERRALAFGRDVSDEQYARLVAMSERGAAYAIVSALAAGPVAAAAAAAAIRAAAAMGRWGAARFAQILAIVAHAGVVLMLRDVIAAPLNYWRETLAAPATLAQLAPMFDEASPAARFFGLIDLFVIWWVIVVGIGVALLYGRRIGPTVIGFMGAYGAFALLLAAAMVVTGGTV